MHPFSPHRPEVLKVCEASDQFCVDFNLTFSVYCSLSVTNNQCYRDESVASRTVVHEELGPILERSTLSKHIFALAFDLTMMSNTQAHN